MKRSKRGLAGFTIIEVLVVLGILVILTSFLVTHLTSLGKTARIKGTKGLLAKIEVALGLYADAFRDLPPDSFDPEGDKDYVYKDGGVVLGKAGAVNASYKNTGCLIYFLCQPQRKSVLRGSGVVGENSPRDRTSTMVGPFLTGLTASNFSIEGFEISQLGVNAGASKVEIVDAWGRPLEYDKLFSLRGHFSGSRFDSDPFSALGTHWPETGLVTGVDDDESDCGVVEDLNKVFDPRRMAGASGCLDRGMKPVPRNVGTFDLWSHGPLWTSPEDDIFAK
ncbi:MAG: type II secretion system protein [Planctomycetota bacterium]|nr:type II secretion system protein [Planctomycetota bacterium]